MKKHLISEIETCREKLIHLTHFYDLTSDVVVETSKRLDVLLNALNKL